MEPEYTIIDEYDNQGRRVPTFLEMPQRHTKTPRTSASDVDMACAIEVYKEDGFSRFTWRAIDALSVIAFVALLAAVITDKL